MLITKSSIHKTNIISYLLMLLLFTPIAVLAQTYSTAQLIEAWRVEGVNQTITAELAYADLSEHFNNVKFAQRVAELEEHLKNNADNKRLAARIMLYKMQGKPGNVAVDELWQCILKTSELKDEQLLSEMYVKYAEFKAPEEEKLYYLLKALQIQERIGVSHFKHIYYRYLTVSGILYHISDFKQSLNYALKGLKSFDKKTNFVLDHIYLLDLAGASYKNLGKLDSALSQYNKLHHLLKDYGLRPGDYSPQKMGDYYLNIWKGITDGGIGRALVLQGKYAAAVPLLKSNLDSAIKYEDFGNAAAVLNVLAEVNYKTHQFPVALKLFQQAHNYGVKANYYWHLKAKLETAEGLTKTFSVLKNTDSAFLYLKEFDLLKDSLQNVTKAFRFSATNTELKFELMQKNFLMAKQEANRYKLLRNISMLSIVVTALLALLLYNRKQLNNKIAQQKLENEKQLAYAEVAHAKEQLNAFARNMVEKNKLIENLQQQYGTETDNTSLKEISILTDNDWLAFKNNFDKVYPNFFENTKQLIPDISAAELRFLSLTKLNMPTKEIANAQGISAESVRKQRHRLRKKIEAIMPNSNVETFLSQV
ncbi:transcriptional regulator [Pedobacter sp. UBA4863]|uniref:transcriptional regulator n=1 Tax=Pedobacter sp. UBA4863 TaxID=1947060 RepID=UPI0025D9B031|nr:transcriptional regulator [Pedobacter sp. UBA4863]